MKYFSAFLLSLCVLGKVPLRALEVTTVDNASTAEDGNLSLLEALTQVGDGEEIKFDIPGEGPHYIITPEGGYPVVAKNGVKIDGYSQPGSEPNRAGLREPNNAKLRIVLDSRTTTPGARRTVLDVPGFSSGESCVLGFKDARGLVVQGLAFIGTAGTGSDADPYVYNVALMRQCSGAKISGCWFGLDPGKTSWKPGPDGVVAGVYGARSAVASFAWSEGGTDYDSEGMTFGNDHRIPDGNNDGRNETNLCMAQRLAVHLETRFARVSGNWFNVFPDGSLLNLEKQELVLEDGTLEAIENGNPVGMIIGTDGNGQGDADEGNIIGPLDYDCVVEFWGSGAGITFAGNSVGVGLDNLPAFTLPGMSLVSIRKDSDIRIGNDWLQHPTLGEEANHIHGLGGTFIAWHGSNSQAGAKAAMVHLRRNELSNNAGSIPLDISVPVPSSKIYEEVLQTPTDAVVTLDPASTVARLKGTFPLPLPDVLPVVIDFYLADTYGLIQSMPSVQGRTWLGKFTADTDNEDDLNGVEGQFEFNVETLNLSAAELERVVFTATYPLPVNGRTVTSNFSMPLGLFTAPPALEGFTIGRDPAGVKLEWTGGVPPFQVLSATGLEGPWLPGAITLGQQFTLPVEGERQFFRIQEGGPLR